MRYLIILLVLTACGGAPGPPTAQSVVDAIEASGVGLSDVNAPEREPDSPLPNSYDEHLQFTMDEVAPKGGSVYVCKTKQNCDALYAYFDMFRGLVGPYLFQSKDGTVVVQLNSGLSAETGAKVAAAIAEL